MNGKPSTNEKKIFRIINEYGKISFNQLKKIVVPKICADQTFQKSLKNMVETGKIIRCPTEVTSHVYYYADENLYDLEKRMEHNIDELITSCDEKLKTFKEEYSKLSDENKASAFGSFSMLLFCIKVKITSIRWVAYNVNFANHRIGKQSNYVNNLSKNMMEFIMKQDDHLKILDLVDTRFGLLVDMLDKEFNDVFTSLHHK